MNRLGAARGSPEVTVVIPVWDLGPVLLDAVARVRGQSVPAEVIVVDNASRTPVAGLDGAQLLRLPRRLSIGEARNAGLRAVRTPFVMFLDADDALAEHALEQLLARAREADAPVAVGGLVAAWDPTASSLDRWHWPPEFALGLSRHPRLFAVANAAKSLCGATATLVRTDVGQRSRGFADGDYCEDWAFVAGLAFRGRVVLIPHVVLHYRNAASGMSQTGQRSLGGIVRARMQMLRHVVTDPDLAAWARLGALITAPYHVAHVARAGLRRAMERRRPSS
jgi:glycosyltransferase involved in cell wall biosynthesis